MLRYLLDEHISPVVAERIVARRPAISAVSIYQWQGGAFAGAGDAGILRAAAADGLTLVSYDVRTIPAALITMAEAGISHAGVIFVKRRTIAPNDFGRLIRSLTAFWEKHARLDWTDRISFLGSLS